MNRPDQKTAEAIAAETGAPVLSRRSALVRLGQGGLAAAVVGVAGHTTRVQAAAPCPVCGMDQECKCEERDLTVRSTTLANLPEVTEETTGRLRLLTDYDRGLWIEAPQQWVSLRGHTFDVRAFGAVGDGETDDWSAFHLAIEAMESTLDDQVDTTTAEGHTLLVPPGVYRLAQSLVINRSIHMSGTGGGGRFADAVLRFDPGIGGITIEGEQPGVTGNPGRTGAGSIIERLRIEAAIPGETTEMTLPPDVPPVHGILLRARATVSQCAVSGFTGNGVRVDPPNGQTEAANGWQVETCEIENCGGHGLGVSRASAGVGTLIDLMNNGQWGIADDSQFGNTYLQCRAAGNAQGAYMSSGTANRSHFVGCAATAGQPRSLFTDTTIVVGGDHGGNFEGGNAWTSTGSRMLLQAQTPEGGETPMPTAPTLRVHGSTGQTQPHLLVQTPADQRIVELTTGSTMLLGPGAETAQPASDALLQIGHPEEGRAGISWAVPIEGGGFVAQARAFADVQETEAGETVSRRLTFQTADPAEGTVDTLTMLAGRVGIGTANPLPQAILDLTAAAQGFLPPRLTDQQRDAIEGPPAGLQIYNVTTGRINFFNGTEWVDPSFFPPRLTSEERDAIESPAAGTLIYNLTTNRLNFHNGTAWQEVAVS
jgi:hypothetical protein